MHPTRSTTLLAALLVLAACDDGVTRTDDVQARQSTRPEGYPTLGEERTGYVLAPDGTPTRVTYNVQEGHAIVEGDIDLGPVEKVARTAEEARRLAPRAGGDAGVVRDAGRWSNGVVPYVISSSLPSPSRVTNAISHIEANTGRVDFVARTNQADYIMIRSSTGCSSSIGRVGGVQYVNLASGCSTGNTIHELLHALGMHHEQTRCDRNTYVTINTANIQTGYSNNFTQQCTNYSDIGSYSEGSIMHYGPYDFSKNGLPTIVSLRGLASQMGQRSGMNSVDISTVNSMYP